MKLPLFVSSTNTSSLLYLYYPSYDMAGIAMASSQEPQFIDVNDHYFTLLELRSYRHALLWENRACSCFEWVVDSW